MSTYRVSAEGAIADDSQSDVNLLLVKIWDLGPTAPVAPGKPELPQGKEGTPAYDLALIDFNAELAKYQEALTAFGKAKKDFAAWQKTYDGPYQMETYSVNAREAIQIEPGRYVAELPKGRKPGKFHTDEIERQKNSRRTFAQTLARDPVFGSQQAT